MPSVKLCLVEVISVSSLVVLDDVVVCWYYIFIVSYFFKL